jgi:flagellar basal body-associated protein FliL
VANRTITPTASEAEPEVQPEEAAEAAEPKPAPVRNFQSWLPLLATVVAMPALAYATTQLLLLPKLKRAMTQAAADISTVPAVAPAKAAATGAKPGKDKVLVPMPKILVNVAGTMMTRYLMTSMTLVGNTSDFKDKIEANKDQLLDVARSALKTKTIADLERPGAGNEMRSELLTVFNNTLGGPVVQDIYITEQAVQ